MREVFIVSAVRTPIGKFGGSLASFPATKLGSLAAKEAIRKAGLVPNQIQETIFGHGRQAGCGPNSARQVSFGAEIPETSPAYTINKACASGMKSIANGFASILLEDNEIVLVGGMESMSNTPYLLPQARWGMKMGNFELSDGMYLDGFSCPISKQLMGQTAENLADDYKISRQEQDEYAEWTQKKCGNALEKGFFKNELVPIEILTRKGNVIFELDEHAKPDSTAESMKKLTPVFRKDGTVHAGNSSGITDGAAALVLASKEKVEELGLKPVAKIIAYQTAGVPARIMGIGPVPATRKLFEKTGFSFDKIGLTELNEAFAAQVIACERELKIPREKLNVNGGSIALGHPIGCTGARIVVTLVHELQRRKEQYGLATLCVSGGLGMSLIVESIY
ncbi:acetyl-CoA C-acetyltransferase [bacterium]|nr:acetyl-CoA C-acetyltransferase [bacterium]